MNRENLYAGKEVLRETLSILRTSVDIISTVFAGLALFGIKPKKQVRSSNRSYDDIDDDYFTACSHDFDDYERALEIYEAYRESKSRQVVSRIDDARQRRLRGIS